MDALLKADANGNLTKITHAEENYIAYQIGLRLSLDTPGTSNAGLKASGSGTTVGTFTDTSFDDAVGSHDGSLTTTTTTVTLKQTTGTASESGGNFHKPVIFDRSATGDVVALKAANDTELNTIVDRALLKTFANEHPGCRRLAASSPGGDWTAALSNVFTDTRTDGTSINYSIWIKTSGSVPTKVAPQILHNTFDIKAMDAAEIQYTFGQRAKTRITATGIGTYLLRNASQGAPTATGTWVAKGTATDTKQTTADVSYTRTSTGNFTGNYDGQYAGDYVGNYDGQFVGDYTGNYTGDYTGNFTGNYDATYTRDSTRDSTDDYTGNYTGNFTGNYDGQYAGNYEGNYDTVRPALETDNLYVRVSTGSANYAGYTGGIAYSGDYSGGIDPNQHFTRVSTRNSTRTFGASTANFTGNYTGDYVGAYVGQYISASDVGYDATYTRDSTAVFTRVSTGNFVGNYTGNYDGQYTRDSTAVFTRDSTRNSQGNYDGAYTRDSIGNYDGQFTRDSTDDYVGNYDGETIQAGNTTIDTYTLYVRTA